MKSFFTIGIVGLVLVFALWVVGEKNVVTTNTSVRSIGNLEGTTLHMSNQGLTKVPISLFESTDIVELDVSHNNLEGALPSQVGKLQNLKVLNVSYNSFTGVPAEIGQLKNLEVLNLSHNKLTGLPLELGNLSKLKMLDVSGNAYAEQDLEAIRKKLPSTTIIKTE
jgi:Leucine-rich repeat (LRR) protein